MSDVVYLPGKARLFGKVSQWLVKGGKARNWKCWFCSYRARTFDELKRHTSEAHPREAKR